MMEWKKNVRVVDPYVPGEQPQEKDIIKLNTNENPYPPAPLVEMAIRTMDTSRFRMYPDSEATELVSELARYHSVQPNQIFVGVGSDDVLAMSFLTFFNGDKPILFPDITYSFYDVWAALFGVSYETPALDLDFRIKKEDYMVPNGGIIIANPNAPTSLYEPLDHIKDIINANRESVVIIDEAYIDFGGESALSLINEYDNLLVVRTFSKSRSMAGIRIGYAIGNTELISSLNAVKGSFNSYTMNMPSIVLGTMSLKEEDYFEKTVQSIIETRGRVAQYLCEKGFQVLPSSTNFLFVTHPEVNAEKIYLTLKEKGIYTRYFKKPRIDSFLRVTVGTAEEMDIFMAEIQIILGQTK